LNFAAASAKMLLMSPRIKWAVGILSVALFGGIIFLTMQQAQQRYEVCVTFNGRSHCATAAGRTAQEAIEAAHAIGCSLLTSGRDDNMVCMQQPPASVRKLP
jgi:FtsH-binding integral membrane protein